jgi:glycosyltransferase involved in cell wall biosynthesis
VTRAASDAPFTIICVARHEKVKNHPMLFDAVARLRQQGRRLRVWLVGEGELRERNERMCAKLGIADVVEFLGYRDDVPALLAQSDVAVLTSLKEGIPRAMMEAMAMAVPTVGTRIPGTVDAIRHGETGFTVETEDSRGLTVRLAQLMDDPALGARLGARGREVALEEFDEDAIIETLGQVYRSLLHRKGIVGPIGFPQVVRS